MLTLTTTHVESEQAQMKHQKDILFFATFNYSWSDIFVHESFQIKASPKINFDNINEPSLTLNFSNPDKKSVNKKPIFFY